MNNKLPYLDPHQLQAARETIRRMSEDDQTKQNNLSGGFTNYYLVQVTDPQRKEQPPYQAECEDIIRSLNMTFDEGCEFKAIWRTAAARLGNGKPGQKAIYDAEKRVHYAKASLRQLLNQERKKNEDH